MSPPRVLMSGVRRRSGSKPAKKLALSEAPKFSWWSLAKVLWRRRKRQETRKTTTLRRTPAKERGAKRSLGRRLGIFIQFFLLIGGIMFVGIAVASALRYSGAQIVNSPYLRLQQLRISGLSRIKEGEVRSYLGITIGAPLLAMDLSAMVKRLERHPWIKSVNIRRRLPDTLIVDIVEQEPMILVRVNEQAQSALYLANNAGELFKRYIPAEDALNLPELTGLTRSQIGKEAKSGLQNILKSGIELKNLLEAERAELGNLEKINWDNDLGWSATLAGIVVHLGRDELAERLQIVKEVLSLLAAKGYTAAVIWVDGPKSNKLVHVRLAKESAPPLDSGSLITVGDTLG